MPNPNTVETLVDGQLAIATIAQSGTIISGRGDETTIALVQTDSGNQLAVKTVLVGPGGAAKPVYVDVLPETGEEGVLYMVNSGVTRDGYAIFQMFSYHENAWVAIGAFDVGISPTGLVYERSFNAATGAWTVGVNQ